jgi:hypothetical protein
MLMIVDQLVEIMIGKETEVLGKIPVPVLLWSSQIPHDLSRPGTRIAAVGRRGLRA